MRLQTIVPAASGVLVLASVKNFIRVDGVYDDTVIQGMISAAEKACQDYTRRCLLPTELGLWFDLGEICPQMGENSSIELPRGKLISVSKIASYDSAGNESIVPASDYYVDNTSDQCGRILFHVYHDGTRTLNSLLVHYLVGYANVAAIPANIIQGLYMLISHWYENREAYENGYVPKTIKNLWNPTKIWKI